MREIRLRVSLNVRVDQGLIRGLPIESLTMLLGPANKMCLTLGLKEAIRVDLPWRHLDVPSVVRSMRKNVLPVWMWEKWTSI